VRRRARCEQTAAVSRWTDPARPLVDDDPVHELAVRVLDLGLEAQISLRDLPDNHIHLGVELLEPRAGFLGALQGCLAP
jgi:hypothetical protein